MKIKIITLLLVVMLAVGAALYDSQMQPEIVKRNTDNKITDITPIPAPVINAVTFTAENISLTSLKEEVILLHFWASWCSVCLAEFPDILKLVEESDGKIALLSISIDDKMENAVKFHDKLQERMKKNVDIPHVYWIWDKNKEISLKQFNIIGVPETIIIDKNRMMIKKVVGPTNWQNDLINP